MPRMGRAEATSFGLLATTIMGGSVFLILAATPYVFNEDLAWSICLTVGGLFALLGVLERPSWGQGVRPAGCWYLPPTSTGSPRGGPVWWVP